MARLRRLIAICLVAAITVQATGCNSWETVMQPVPIAIGRNPGRKVQVVLGSTASITVDSARTDGSGVITFRRLRVDTIPLTDVDAVKVRAIDPFKTFLAVVGVVSGGLLMLLLFAAAASEGS